MTQESNWRMGLGGTMAQLDPEDEQNLVTQIAEKVREIIETFPGLKVEVCIFKAGPSN